MKQRKLRPSIQNSMIALTLLCAIILSGCDLMTWGSVFATIILLIVMVANVVILSIYGKQDNE